MHSLPKRVADLSDSETEPMPGQPRPLMDTGKHVHDLPGLAAATKAKAKAKATVAKAKAKAKTKDGTAKTAAGNADATLPSGAVAPVGDHGKRRSSATNLDESGNIEGTGKGKGSGKGKGQKQGMKKLEQGAPPTTRTTQASASS